MTSTGNRIDVHHHALPAPYVDALKSSGKPQLAGVDPIHWDVETDIEVMDRNGIAIAVLDRDLLELGSWVEEEDAGAEAEVRWSRAY